MLIRNGRVIDGTGNPWRAADIAIKDGRIAAMGRLGDAQAARVIDAAGLTVTPGFIDVHSHAANGLSGALKEGRPLLAQGLTTVTLNPDGGGPVDIKAQRAAFEKNGTGVNTALYIGHGSIRREVLGMADRAPTAAELDRMIALAKRGHGRRRDRPVDGAVLRAGELLEDRRARSRSRRSRRRAAACSRATSATRATTPSASSRRSRK